MPAAIPYIRFSSARQTTGSSAERQQQMVTQWLTQHSEYTLSDLTYEDLGRSGYHGDHIREGGGFAKLLQAVEAGSIKAGDVVLVEAIDRTGRLSPMRMLRDVISPIIESGVSIITLDDGVTYNRDSVEGGHLFLLVAKIQAAHGYSKALSERTKASYAIRREQAKATGKVKRNTPIWLDSNGKPNEDVVPYIKQVFELYVSGVGKTAIANRLRASGVKELATCSGPTVEAWLRNQAVIGNWEYGKDNDKVQTEIIRGVYPAVVSEELFQLAQQRKKAAATKPRERTSRHFLVGLVKCGACNSNYIIHNKDGKPNNMRCGLHHRLKSAGCTNAETIPYQVVHSLFVSTAHLYIGKALQAIQLTENDKRKLALNAERDEVVSGIERLVKLALKFDSPQIEVELEAAEKRRKSIDEELSVLERSDDADKRVGGSHFESQYKSAVEHDRMLKDDPIQLSALLRQAGYTITVHIGHKLFVSDDVEPWVYLGVKRKGNQTLGYRIKSAEEEWLISPTIPQPPVVTDHSDQLSDHLKYIFQRTVSFEGYLQSQVEWRTK
ncbi:MULTISPECIES: recombinase family protein [unclassified Pseudomonas]|uniref:recombinase family protein n=1 Tax=unclassified Pseudomonas TaxID=196821 RepID=UPI00224A7BFC|nr:MULTISPECIES: recombinase family protein [unclassified Pseudomonas]MCX2814568.1 recombinase family protein [Pseudomonas sp. DCB_E]MCX9143951.1 recombinase family protein [Pseudomonas sp. DCB_Q]